MSRVWKVAAALKHEQSGLTLVELLVASMLGLLVVGAGLSIFIGAVRSEPRTSSKVAAIQQARFTVDRIVRELRQGWDATASPSQLSMTTYVKAVSCNGPVAGTAIPCKVTYTCAGEACTRVVAQPDGSAPGPAVQVAGGLASANVFSPAPLTEPTYVGVTFAFATDGEPFTLGDGAALRNPSEES
jgi:type IV pilus assembly protein PilW